LPATNTRSGISGFTGLGDKKGKFIEMGTAKEFFGLRALAAMPRFVARAATAEMDVGLRLRETFAGEKLGIKTLVAC
jgi:hypothetical protein